MSKIFEFTDVTRITVVSETGVEYERYDVYTNGVELHLQDDGKTLKLFPAPGPDDLMPTQSVLRAACGAIYSHDSHGFSRHGTSYGCDGVLR